MILPDHFSYEPVRRWRPEFEQRTQRRRVYYRMARQIFRQVQGTAQSQLVDVIDLTLDM